MTTRRTRLSTRVPRAFAPALILCLVVTATSCTPTTEFRETVSTKVLMSAVLEPAADGVWDAVGTVMTLEGTEEIAPSTPEEWLAVRNAAITLAESANLLLTPRRFVDHDHWTGWSLDLADAGRKAMVAAESQDVDELFEAGGLIYESCTGCHNEYWTNDPNRAFAP